MRTEYVTMPSLYVTGAQSFYSLRPSPAAMPEATNVLWYRHDGKVLSEDFSKTYRISSKGFVKLSDDMRMVEFFICKIKKPTLDAGCA